MTSVTLELLAAASRNISFVYFSGMNESIKQWGEVP